MDKKCFEKLQSQQPFQASEKEREDLEFEAAIVLKSLKMEYLLLKFVYEMIKVCLFKFI